MPMFARAVLNDEERAVDPQLGFPRGYAKLCRHAYIQAQGLISPFTEGPPQRFHPYAVEDEQIAKLKEYDNLFPILEEGHRDATNPKKHIDSLWQQLDHLGNAGFDPAIFRVDIYGNVLYWDADPGSPLAWEVDHWFPQARGGKAVPGNLRLVQWQASHRKGKKMEFLVPWWDLQLGISVNQFLSVFASKNASFRHRAFSFFFPFGENEQLNNCKVVQGHSWPRHFKDQKNQVGLAAAALVQVQNAVAGGLQSINSNYRVAKQEYPVAGFTGNCNEAVKRDLQIVGLDYYKDSKIKHSRKGEFVLDKENEGLVTDKCFAPLQREQYWKQQIEEDKKHKLKESVHLEEELQIMKAQNVKEKAVLDQLEHNLAKQKKRVEKQRRWSETQSQYRLCLEKMIRDTLHQCVVYKEQARLNQAACNALLARLESQKSACDAAEEELVRKVRQREDLQASARPQITKRVRHQGHTDVGSCLKPGAVLNVECLVNTNASCDPQEVTPPSQKGSDDHDNARCKESKICLQPRTGSQQLDKVEMKESVPFDIGLDQQELGMTCPKLLVRNKYATGGCVSQKKAYHATDANVQKCIGRQAEDIDDSLQIVLAQGNPGAKRRTLEESDELEVVLLGYEYQENEDDANREESIGDNGTTHNSILRNYSDNDEDDGSNVNTHKNQDAYEESNNGDRDFDADHDTKDGYDQHRNSDDSMESGIQPAPVEMGETECVTEHMALQAYRSRESDERVEPFRIAKTKDAEQLDELLQEVLAMQDRVNEAMVDAIQEEQDEERVKRVGKLNLDKWLQKLLLDSGYGHGQEHTPLISLPVDVHSSLGCQKQVMRVASEEHKGLTMKDKCGNLDNEKEIGGHKSVCNLNQQLVDGTTESMIGGILKKLSLKIGDAPHSSEIEDTKLVVSVEKTGVSKEDRKPLERRTSPWRWVSPVSKRSTSTGSETRARRLSPWRRSSKEDKVEERKMMEDFSKLRVGGEKQQGAEAIVSNVQSRSGVFDISLKARERSASAKLKSCTGVPQGVRERSTSTPPAKGQCNSRMALSPIPHSHDILLSKTRAVSMQVLHRKDDSGGDDERAKCGMAGVGANAGATRKANMLKRSATTRGGRGESSDMRTPALAGSGGSGRFEEMGAPAPAGRAGGSVPYEEDNEEHKGSIFEDLDPQDGLRASLSMAWRKAVKKFELGRPPLSTSSNVPSAHLEL
ncbi:hypothetical protein GOP47_0024339 [Adiantum capillus-veneris]|uniref:Uncharacterized protein n=1 Tax=Adiantum capillus-veneris TaxID=13818 RepID=A0A9D4Z3L0_ADICA|nr:hypothetical protein GOP47_0024339 [Adiantum capillus-veneris]